MNQIQNIYIYIYKDVTIPVKAGDLLLHYNNTTQSQSVHINWSKIVLI